MAPEHRRCSSRLFLQQRSNSPTLGAASESVPAFISLQAGRVTGAWQPSRGRFEHPHYWSCWIRDCAAKWRPRCRLGLGDREIVEAAEDPKLPIRPAMRPPSQGESCRLPGASLALRIVTLLCGVVHPAGLSGEMALTTMDAPDRIEAPLG